MVGTLTVNTLGQRTPQCIQLRQAEVLQVAEIQLLPLDWGITARSTLRDKGSWALCTFIYVLILLWRNIFAIMFPVVALPNLTTSPPSPAPNSSHLLLLLLSSQLVPERAQCGSHFLLQTTWLASTYRGRGSVDGLEGLRGDSDAFSCL